MEHQNKLIAESRAAVEEAEKKLAAKAEGTGVPPLGSGKARGGVDDDGDPIALFDAKVRALTANGMARLTAVASVARNNPELHKAYLLATNADSKKAQRLIEEKYGD
jgi:hypothetical protein